MKLRTKWQTTVTWKSESKLVSLIHTSCVRVCVCVCKRECVCVCLYVCVPACLRACAHVFVSKPRPHALSSRDVSGRMSPIAFSCRNGSAETGASVWALLWQNQQKHPEPNSLPRQTHWHRHPDPRSLPEPEGKTEPTLWTLDLASLCVCVFFFYSYIFFFFLSLNRLPTPGTVQISIGGKHSLLVPCGSNLNK